MLRCTERAQQSGGPLPSSGTIIRRTPTSVAGQSYSGTPELFPLRPFLSGAPWDLIPFSWPQTGKFWAQRRWDGALDWVLPSSLSTGSRDAEISLWKPFGPRDAVFAATAVIRPRGPLASWRDQPVELVLHDSVHEEAVDFSGQTTSSCRGPDDSTDPPSKPALNAELRVLRCSRHRAPILRRQVLTLWIPINPARSRSFSSKDSGPAPCTGYECLITCVPILASVRRISSGLFYTRRVIHFQSPLCPCADHCARFVSRFDPKELMLLSIRWSFWERAPADRHLECWSSQAAMNSGTQFFQGRSSEINAPPEVQGRTGGDVLL